MTEKYQVQIRLFDSHDDSWFVVEQFDKDGLIDFVKKHYESQKYEEDVTKMTLEEVKRHCVSIFLGIIIEHESIFVKCRKGDVMVLCIRESTAFWISLEKVDYYYT